MNPYSGYQRTPAGEGDRSAPVPTPFSVLNEAADRERMAAEQTEAVVGTNLTPFVSNLELDPINAGFLSSCLQFFSIDFSLLNRFLFACGRSTSLTDLYRRNLRGL
jgi:hypothetical protein